MQQNECGDKFFIISKGQVSLIKKIEYTNEYGKKVSKKIKMIQLHQGDIFGQEIVISNTKKNGQSSESTEHKIAGKLWKMLKPNL